jgi:hypothetical protein
MLKTVIWSPTPAMQFAAEGYSVMEMGGGLESWKENGLHIEK